MGTASTWEADQSPCRVCCAELKPGDSYDRAIRLLNHDNRWKVRPGYSAARLTE